MIAVELGDFRKRSSGEMASASAPTDAGSTSLRFQRKGYGSSSVPDPSIAMPPKSSETSTNRW